MKPPKHNRTLLGMGTNRGVLGLIAIMLPLCGPAATTSAKAAKEEAKLEFHEAEIYLKDGSIAEAREHYCKAAELDLKNDTYRRKCRETATTVFTRSLESPPQKAPEPNDGVQAAKADVTTAISLLQKGEVDSAASLLKSAEPYRKDIESFDKAEWYLRKSKDVIEAQKLWEEKHDALNALLYVTLAEQAFPSDFVKGISRRVHREISADLTRTALSMPTDTPLHRIERLKALEKAVAADPTDEISSFALTQNASELASILSAISDQRGQLAESAPRVSLERLLLVQQWLKGDSAFQQNLKTLRSRAYPLATVGVVASGIDECLPYIKDAFRLKAIQPPASPAFNPVNGTADIFIRLSGSCTYADIPRQNIQKVNSTYVATTIQVPNPEYAKLQTQLTAAEQALNRALAGFTSNRLHSRSVFA